MYAPADGMVVRVKDGIPDNSEFGDADWKARDPRGNYVVIRHDSGEYSHLAHFKNYTLEVRPASRVKRGQRIGLCGNSGHSTEPHLHLQIQNRAGFFLSIGLPVKFSHYMFKKDGLYQKMKRGYLSKGERVMCADTSGAEQTENKGNTVPSLPPDES
ncbi:MAG: M23 family metallopeptidase [Candidatus Aminicenantales bacterium]